MFEVFQASESSNVKRRAYFQCVDATDGITPETGLTGTGKISKNGSATATTANNITEIDSTNMPGRYYIEFSQAEVDTAGQLIFRYKNAACAEVIVQSSIVSFDPYAAGPTVANIVAGIYDEPRSSHTIVGTYGQGVSSVQGNVTGSVGSVTGNVGGNVVGTVASVLGNVSGNVTGTVGGVLAGGIVAGTIVSAALNEIADAVLKRDWTSVVGEASRSVLNALRAIRNKSSVSGATVTITKEDDVTAAYTAVVVGTPSVTSYDPT